MKKDELKKHIEWLQQTELQTYLKSSNVPAPWFPAYKHQNNQDQGVTWFSALVPINLIPTLVQNGMSWDIRIGDGSPSVWKYLNEGKESKRVYTPFGNEEGIEPLVLHRNFHGLHERVIEVAQEFRLYHNLYAQPSRNRFLIFNQDGDESEAVRYGEYFVEIRTDLLLRFCAVKQMALAVYVDSSKNSLLPLEKLGLQETRLSLSGEIYTYHLGIVPADTVLRDGFETFSHLIGKKYILPGPMPTDDNEQREETYQEFIIGTDANGKAIKYTCDPEKLANYFGKNPEAPNYLTPVFFRPEVLSKYYADPRKYSVEDGHLRCSGLWGLRMDNDHSDYVVVWLGDLGRDLSESERNYWLSFNIPPHGRKISKTKFDRAFMAQFADPIRPDLEFKNRYKYFCESFQKVHGWDFFLPLHSDDEHFLISLHLPTKDNQAEFDTQLLALTKILVDSLNEKEILKRIKTKRKDEKGISKLERFFSEHGIGGFDRHIKFLRALQDLRSKSAAHRKGSNYDELVKKFKLADVGQQKVFGFLLSAGTDFIQFLRQNLLPPQEK